MRHFVSLSVIARIVASILLLWALPRHPYGYYAVLRWVVCSAAAYSAYISSLIGRLPWAWFFGILALFFNPIIPVKLDRAAWANIDIAAAIALLVSIFFVRENLPRKGAAVMIKKQTQDKERKDTIKLRKTMDTNRLDTPLDRFDLRAIMLALRFVRKAMGSEFTLDWRVKRKVSKRCYEVTMPEHEWDFYEDNMYELFVAEKKLQEQIPAEVIDANKPLTSQLSFSSKYDKEIDVIDIGTAVTALKFLRKAVSRYDGKKIEIDEMDMKYYESILSDTIIAEVKLNRLEMGVQITIRDTSYSEHVADTTPVKSWEEKQKKE